MAADCEAALVVARESGDRHREGQFLSYLGLLPGQIPNWGSRSPASGISLDTSNARELTAR
jgi:hypothetical protein